MAFSNPIAGHQKNLRCCRKIGREAKRNTL